MGLAEGGPWAALQVCWDPATTLRGSPSLPVTALPSIRRWQQSAKSSGLASNLQPSGAKADALREEMEEAANRVEICRVPGGPRGIAPCWGGGTLVSQAPRKTCSLSSYSVLHPGMLPEPCTLLRCAAISPVVNKPLAMQREAGTGKLGV